MKNKLKFKSRKSKFSNQNFLKENLVYIFEFIIMLSLKANLKEKRGRKVKTLRKAGIVPAVLYGPKIKSQPIEVKLNDFKKIYSKAGESSLISLEIEPVRNHARPAESGTPKEPKGRAISDGVDNKKFLVLIHEITKDPLTLEISHIDFYQPQLDKEVEATVPLVFEGESPAVKDLGGTLIREIQEVRVKAFPQNLPHDIKVDISGLLTFEDEIKIKDLKLPPGIKVLKEAEEIIALVVPPAKIEEELEKPIEEKVEEVEKVETKKEKKEKIEETAGQKEEKKAETKTETKGV